MKNTTKKPTVDQQILTCLPCTPAQAAAKLKLNACAVLCRLQVFQQYKLAKEQRPAGDVGPTIYNVWTVAS